MFSLFSFQTTQHEDGLVTSVAAPMYNVILQDDDESS